MNYNNFSSRISTPKSNQTAAPSPAVTAGKKAPKRVRRMPGAAVAVIPLLILLGFASAANAEVVPDAPAPVATVEILPGPYRFSKGLSPITEAVILVGFAVAGIQGRLLVSRREIVW